MTTLGFILDAHHRSLGYMGGQGPMLHWQKDKKKKRRIEFPQDNVVRLLSPRQLCILFRRAYPLPKCWLISINPYQVPASRLGAEPYALLATPEEQPLKSCKPRMRPSSSCQANTTKPVQTEPKGWEPGWRWRGCCLFFLRHCSVTKILQHTGRSGTRLAFAASHMNRRVLRHQ